MDSAPVEILVNGCAGAGVVHGAQHLQPGQVHPRRVRGAGPHDGAGSVPLCLRFLPVDIVLSLRLTVTLRCGAQPAEVYDSDDAAFVQQCRDHSACPSVSGPCDTTSTVARCVLACPCRTHSLILNPISLPRFAVPSYKQCRHVARDAASVPSSARCSSLPALDSSRSCGLAQASSHTHHRDRYALPCNIAVLTV